MVKKKNEELEKAEKKLIKAIDFSISIQKHELVKKDLKSTYPKWKLWLCKKLDIVVADNYDWCYRIQYKGNTKSLKSGDVMINSEGRAFYVMKELNRVAMVVTPKPSIEPPFMFGTFRVLVKPKNQI